jgi:hypothetical protein
MPPTIQTSAKKASKSPRRILIWPCFVAITVMTRALPQSTRRLEKSVRYRSKPQRINKTGTIKGQAVKPMALAAIPINNDRGTSINVSSRIVFFLFLALLFSSYFKCPGTMQMRCPVNAYLFLPDSPTLFNASLKIIGPII